MSELEKGDCILRGAPHAGIPGPHLFSPTSQSPLDSLVCSQLVKVSERAVLYVEGDCRCQDTVGHHLEGLVVLDLAVMPDIDIRMFGDFPTSTLAREEGWVWGSKQVKPWVSEGL